MLVCFFFFKDWLSLHIYEENYFSRGTRILFPSFIPRVVFDEERLELRLEGGHAVCVPLTTCVGSFYWAPFLNLFVREF